MIYDFPLKARAGDAQDWCASVRLGACGALVPVADVAQIVCTARNMGTNAIIGVRNAQNVFGANGGTYALNAEGEPEFAFRLSALDTALVGSAATTARETHVFQFTFTLDDGTIGTFPLYVTCLARPAVSMATAADIGRIRQRFRTLINEPDLASPNDDWLDSYLQDGAESANDVLRYHVADSVITLVAGTAEYDFPADCIEFLWAEWNGKPVDLYSQDQQRRRGRWWRSQPQGPPEQYMLWGRKIIVVPTPDAAAIVTDPTLLVRGCTTPAPFALNGFVQLGSQHWDIPLLDGAARWFAGPLGNQPQLSGAYQKQFMERAQAAAAVYAEREVI